MIHFLLTYSLTKGELVDVQQFRDGAIAARAYVDAEKARVGDDDYEIVLVGADSLDALKTTHGHYFSGTTGSTSPYLSGV
jgi:hypothetical protein